MYYRITTVNVMQVIKIKYEKIKFCDFVHCSKRLKPEVRPIKDVYFEL